MTSTLPSQFNIMFTCAGRRVALMQAFRAAMSELGLSGSIIATDVTSASAAIHKADLGIIVPTVDQEHYIPTLLEHVRSRRVKLLVPLTDIDLSLLAHHREQFAQEGCTVMIGSERVVGICRDKGKTNDLLARAALPTIRTLSLAEFLPSPFYPCFVKPVRGSAGVGSAVIRGDKELHAHLAAFGEGMIVQEYLDGPEYTVDVYRSRGGQVLCAVPRQRLVVRSGEVEKSVTVRDKQVTDDTVRIAGLLNDLWGVFCCQCRRRREGGEPHFFEINPRFGGGAPLSIAAGANLPLYLLQEVLGLPITARMGQVTDRLLMLRYDDALFVQADDPESLPGFQAPQFR